MSPKKKTQTPKKLNRTTFKKSRLLDFCSEKELTAQTGHPREAWPVVILKELLDNALDSCEEAGIAPEIRVVVDDTGITIADNGLGIPAETIEGVLDFTVRVSSRGAYVSPARGAQGNALKTIIMMPYVLDGESGRVDITSQGVRHEIAVRVDHIRQRPVISHEKHTEIVRTGTVIHVFWPDLARSVTGEAKCRFLQIANDFTFLNPHLTLDADWYGEETHVDATDKDWQKWLPSMPTSPHWYTVERLGDLVSAYISHDEDLGQERTVREFLSEFRGLAGSIKQKRILDATETARRNLSDLKNGNGLDSDLLKELLASMKSESKAVKPGAIGIIGKAHLAQRCEELGCKRESFQYKKFEGEEGGVPYVIEAAFAWKGENAGRVLVTGVNWSPGIVNPFRELGPFGESLDSILEERRAGREDPIVVVLHLACPHVQYTDRGKSAVVLGNSRTDEYEDYEDEEWEYE